MQTDEGIEDEELGAKLGDASRSRSTSSRTDGAEMTWMSRSPSSRPAVAAMPASR